MSALDEQFHKLWGQAKEQVYDKPAWIEMQRQIQEWADTPSWFADKLLELWPFLKQETHNELLRALKERKPEVHALVADRLEWKPFTKDFDYVKKFYDVKLSDGTIVEQCWPNSGFLNEMSGCRIFDHKDSVSVRLSLRHPMDD